MVPSHLGSGIYHMGNIPSTVWCLPWKVHNPLVKNCFAWRGPDPHHTLDSPNIHAVSFCYTQGEGKTTLHCCPACLQTLPMSPQSREEESDISKCIKPLMPERFR